MFNFSKLYLASLCLLMLPLEGAENEVVESTGTLIVTYQTGPAEERLERIRFIINDAHHKQQMYPKSGASFIDEDPYHARMVVIDDIPTGDYTIDFVIPNCDSLFEEVPIRKFSITQDEVLKIDQAIKIRYASLQASVQLEENATPLVVEPTITLKNMKDEIVLEGHGKLSEVNVVPGKYLLTFQELEGYRTPDPIQITLLPHQTAGPLIGMYLKMTKTM